MKYVTISDQQFTALKSTSHSSASHAVICKVLDMLVLAQALRFMMLQYNQFKRCSALMPIAALLDNGKVSHPDHAAFSRLRSQLVQRRKH